MEPRKGLALHWQILIGLGVGAVAGLVANGLFDPAKGKPLYTLTVNVIEPAGKIFLRLILMVVLPLVFSALVLGITGLGDLRKLGRLGLKTLAYTVLLSTISVILGLAVINLARPGSRLPEAKRDQLKAMGASSEDAKKISETARKAKSIRDILVTLIPENPVQEMVGALDGSAPGGGMLSVMFFALVFGIALSVTPARAGPLIGVLEGLYDASLTVIGWAMKLAPIGVAAFVFSRTALLGLDLLKTLGFYVGTVVIALATHLFVVYSLVVLLLGRRAPGRFFKQCSEALLTAFGTSSSNATLPTSLRVAEERLGIRKEVARFVLTVGSTANQNGTALYEGMTVLFLAQVYGIDLTAAQQVTVLLMSVLAGIGTAGVPGGSLPLVVSVLFTVGIPAEGIAIILGVDRILDMCRTVVNVAGDLVVASCVDHSSPTVADAGSQGRIASSTNT